MVIRRILYICGLTFPIMVFANRPPETSHEQLGGRSVAGWTDLMKRLEPGSKVSPEVVDGLRGLVNDPEVDSVVRRRAALTLGRIGPAAKTAVADLRKLLETTDSIDIQRWCLKGLSLFGRNAAPATNAIVAALKDPRSPPGVRIAAIEALSQIGVAHHLTVPTLISMTSPAARPVRFDDVSAGIQVRVSAIESIAFIGAPANSSIPSLIDCTRDPDFFVRRAAVMALKSMGALSEVAVPALWDAATGDSSEAVRDEAISALGGAGKAGRKVLLRLCQDEDWTIRLRAVETAVGRMKDFEKLSGAVRNSLLDPRMEVRFAAAVGLIDDRQLGERVEEIIVEAMNSRSRQLRIQAAAAIVDSFSNSPTVRERLKELSASQYPAVRDAARRTFQKLDR